MTQAYISSNNNRMIFSGCVYILVSPRVQQYFSYIVMEHGRPDSKFWLSARHQAMPWAARVFSCAQFIPTTIRGTPTLFLHIVNPQQEFKPQFCDHKSKFILCTTGFATTGFIAKMVMEQGLLAQHQPFSVNLLIKMVNKVNRDKDILQKIQQSSFINLNVEN